MAASPLVEAWIEDGSKLIDALVRDGFDVDFALWSYFEEPDEWRLVIASERAEEGPRAAYSAISRTMGGIAPPLRFDLPQVVVVARDNPLITILKKHFKMPPGTIGYSMNDLVLDGTRFGGAYIYGPSHSPGQFAHQGASPH
jgi:hypothetical protein